MCTMTAISTGRGGAPGLRVMFNRDELRARPAAWPPRIVAAGGRRVVMPIDPQGGGTWIAANDAGLVFAVLNRNCGCARVDLSTAAKSRGVIIPKLLHCQNLAEMAAEAARIDPTDYSQFRFVVLSISGGCEVSSDGLRLDSRPVRQEDLPVFFTSSGLGDAQVEGPRAALFHAIVPKAPDQAAAQESFHRSRFQDYPELSVLMTRADARTVSVTRVEVDSRGVCLEYRHQVDDAAAEIEQVQL